RAGRAADRPQTGELAGCVVRQPGRRGNALAAGLDQQLRRPPPAAVLLSLAAPGLDQRDRSVDLGGAGDLPAGTFSGTAGGFGDRFRSDPEPAAWPRRGVDGTGLSAAL